MKRLWSVAMFLGVMPPASLAQSQQTPASVVEELLAAEGWRVAAFKRGVRAPGEVSTLMMAPALPSKLVPPGSDTAAIAAHGRSVGNAERAFSDEAQSIGLPAAFAKYGSEDAVNMGGGRSPGFIVSAAAIGRSMQEGEKVEPSPVSWGADKVLAASAETSE